MSREERTSNALGVPIPLWVINQLDKRSRELSVQNPGDSSKINDNIKFRGNRSAWVRMVSSVDLLNPKEAAAKIPNRAFDYFKTTIGLNIQDQTDLAKLFVLQGGVSKYESTRSTQFSYNLRNGFKEAYNVNGTEREINKYGYRPMPGITSARIQTTGKLGSIKSADIQIKVWDKEQLDIIDALYFKLGYSILLEWGHTYYYDSEKGDLKDTESFSINPFQQGITKEDIFNKISNNVRSSEGNYDAMLGIVTNFNFTYNQEGGYDCTIKLISLGVLISNMKMNNPRVLPDIQQYVVKKLYNRLEAIQKEKEAKDKQILENQRSEEKLNYPPCVRNRGDISSPPAERNSQKSLGKEAIFATVNNVTYFFYPDGKYQTSGFSKSGTYTCQGSEIFIDGVNENLNKKTYEQIIKGNEKEIRYLYAPYSPGNPLSVLTSNQQLDTLRGSKNLSKPYAYEIEVVDTEYLAFNKFKTLLPKFGFADDDFQVEAKVKFPNFAVVEDTKNLIESNYNYREFPDFKKSQEGAVPKITVQRKAIDLLTQQREIKGLYGGAPITFEGSTLTLSQYIALGTSNFDKNSSKRNESYYKSYIEYTDILENRELQEYLLVLSYTQNAVSSGGKTKSTSPENIVAGSDQDKIRQKILETLNNQEEIWNVVNVSRVSLPTATGIFTNINKKIPKVLISLEKQISISIPTEEVKENEIDPNTDIQQFEKITKDVQYVITLRIDTTDIGVIDQLEVKTKLGFTILDAGTLSKQQEAQNTEDVANTESTPPISVADIQKSETEKYRSAFEVIIRTLQLYSLDQSVESGIEKDHVIKNTYLLNPSIYNEFTKEIFSSGLFSKLLGPDASVGNTKPGTNEQGKRSDLIYYVTNANQNKNDILNSDTAKLCADYDKAMKEGNGTVKDKDLLLKVRALFGFHFALLGNQTTAVDLLGKKCFVDYGLLMSTYTIPYEFESGIFEGTQLNHPVYVPLGLVIMILNHICTIYDKESPLVYFDFNHKTNLCLSNAKHLSTNPYEIIIPFQGTNSDFASILEPSTVALAKGNQSGNKVLAIKPTKEKKDGDEEGAIPIFTPYNPNNGNEVVKDRISGGLLPFKFTDGVEDTYRGRTMNILISCDYLLKMVSTFTKNNGSGDVYAREFIEQILFDANKYMGDVNIFRMAYDDKGNVAHIVDDQMTPNLEGEYPVANESIKDPKNRSKLPLFGIGSIARSLEIRTEVSSKLSNMIAISANSSYEDQSSLSKSAESFGFYNLSYTDRYIPTRTEFSSSVTLPTDTMIRSTLQFNESIKSFYGSAKPAYTAVSHATNYYIQRMSKIKSSEIGTRAAAMIPVSLNFSIDGMSGFGMGQSFTIDPEFLPYTYNLSSTNPFGEQERDRTIAFVMVGLDHIIEGNQWISNVRSNMIFAKKAQDFTTGVEKLRNLEKPTDGLFDSGASQGGIDYGNIPDNYAGCTRSKGILNENIIESSTIKSVYGSPVKGKQSFIAKLEAAYQVLQSQGITLKIGDNLRSFDTQKAEYEQYLKNVQLQKEGKEWFKNGERNPPSRVPDNIAHPCAGYHVQGQAIDLEQIADQQKDILAEGVIYKALYDQGLRRISNEWWHWSLGEVN